MSDWAFGEASRRALGDTDNWVRTLPDLWRGFAFPDGPWRPPPLPREPVRHWESFDYWSPLLHLVLGPLAWADPALGASRWVGSGLPVQDPATRVLSAWWGTDVLAIAAWERIHSQPSRIAESLAQGLPGARPTRNRNASPGPEPDNAELQMLERDPVRRHWLQIVGGGYDPLHLGGHVNNALLSSPQPDASKGEHFVADLDQATAALILPSYQGWCRRLAEQGSKVTNSPTRDRWQIDVVARPIGWLGTYRLSPITGRWYACSHDVHLMGWPGDGDR